MSDLDVDAFAGQRIALALSGGGSRAIAFHLGCLRALHEVGLLSRVSVISSVSGGSVLAALYCSTPGDFEAFEAKARLVIRRGFVRGALWAALSTSEGIKAAVNFMVLGGDRSAAWVVRSLLRTVPFNLRPNIAWLTEPKLRRSASRTTILRTAMARVFEGRMLSDLRTDRPKLIIVSCDLRYKSAFYFAREEAGSWRIGRASADKVSIAEAVCASAAFPGMLPALDLDMTFTPIPGGEATTQRVTLTDGGVYDNLGLAPLWPERDPYISLHVEAVDRIIACRAGYGVTVDPPATFWPSRMFAVLETIHTRAQNAAVNKLFALKDAGRIKGFIVPYLGQNDAHLQFPPVDLVSAESTANYPTSFSAMPLKWVAQLVLRGEQLTKALLTEHWR